MTPSFESFSDEMVKIAFFKRVAKGFTSALGEGWHGVGAANAVTRNTWAGKGRQIKPSYDPSAFSHRPMDPRSLAAGHRYRPTAGHRVMEEVTSLGGLTKALPVGAKSMLAAGTGIMALQAMKPHDPTGMERSRAERLTGLGANTVGGLAGSALAMRALRGRGGFLGAIAAPMVGGMLGGHLAEKAVTTPFRAARVAGAAQPLPQEPSYGYYTPPGVPMPGAHV